MEIIAVVVVVVVLAAARVRYYMPPWRWLNYRGRTHWLLINGTHPVKLRDTGDGRLLAARWLRVTRYYDLKTETPRGWPVGCHIERVI